MKKILCCTLSIVALFLTFGCEKKDITETPTDNKDFVVEETTEKNSPKYNSKYFSANALEVIGSQYNYEQHENEDFKKVYNSINGRILDSYYYDKNIYFLTPGGLYYMNEHFGWYGVKQIDTKDNTKIELITDEYIILKNDNNEYNVYYSRLGDGEYKIYQSQDFKITENERLIGYHDFLMLWDYIYIITNVDKNGITAKTFSMGSAYSESNEFVMQSNKTYPFSKTLDSNIKDYITSTNNDYNDYLNGMILLENNKAYYIEARFGDLYSTSETVKIKTDAIENVDKIYNTRNSNKFYLTKINEKNCIYKYTFNEKDKVITSEVTKINLPTGITTDSIESISYTGDHSKSYIKLTNGDIYEFNNIYITNGNTDKLPIKIEVLTNAFNNKKITNQYFLAGLNIFVMDDGNIYSHIDDDLINRYNLK